MRRHLDMEKLKQFELFSFIIFCALTSPREVILFLLLVVCLAWSFTELVDYLDYIIERRNKQ